MAYTYDDFVTAATGAGMLEKFSDEDLRIAKTNPEYGISALKLQQELAGASTTEQKLLAQEAINQLRTSYGNENKQNGSFAYDKQTQYQQLLDEVTGMGSFQYDPQNDPNYGSMKKTYLREGERARADTLAKVSAATGGAPSSYAVAAAQQAGDYYNTKFADMLPTLEQNAYARYLNDFETKLQQLDILKDDRSFDYNAYLNLFEREQAQKADEEARKQQEWNNALALYQILGYATPEIAEILGLNGGTAGETGGTGSGGGGGGGGNTNTEVQLAEPKGDTGSGDATVDMNSVIQLGYGPISEAGLAELVASGEVEMYQEGNVIRFKKAEQPQPPNLPGPSLWNFTQNQMNKATGNSSNKNSGNTSSKKKGGGGGGVGVNSRPTQIAFFN